MCLFLFLGYVKRFLRRININNYLKNLFEQRNATKPIPNLERSWRIVRNSNRKNLERNKRPTEKRNQIVFPRFQDRLCLVFLQVSSLMIICVICFDPLIIRVLSISDETLLYGLINVHLICSLRNFRSVYFRVTSES